MNERQARVAAIRGSVTAADLSVNAATRHKMDLKSIPCQICSKKGHGALNCFNRYNSRFPPTNNRAMQNMPKAGPSVNYAADNSYSDRNMVWYPDSGATNHITDDDRNIQKSKNYTTLPLELPMVRK